MIRAKQALAFVRSALLLAAVAGCGELPVTPTPMATADETTPSATVLSAYISGPTSVVGGSNYTWYANPTGGSGSYTYQWLYRLAGNSTWIVVGSGTSYTRKPHATFQLRLIVTSDGVSVNPTIEVEVQPLCDPETC